MAMVMADNQREQQQVDVPTVQINIKEPQEQNEEPGEDVLILLEDEDEFHLDPNEQDENQQAVYYLQDHEEEEKEEEEDEDDGDEDQFNIPQNTEFLQEEEEIEGDEAFYLANRTFYTTCHKISRQNSPSYRKKPPYTFLENWLIHSVFSKSQQILLRFPVIHPKVMMTEGDFIYTPHQMATESNNESDNQQQQYYQNDENQGQQMDYEYGDEEEYDYYDDAFIIGDEGVMVMSASAPDASQFMAEDEDDEQDELHASSLVMDENMWMGHSRYNSNGLTLHVVNPDDKPEEDDDPMYHNVVSSNNPYKSIVHSSSPYQGQLQMVQEEEEEEEEEVDDVYENGEEEQHGNATANYGKHNETHAYQSTEDVYETEAHNMNLSMSPEVLNWYRSADLRPVTLSAPIVVDDNNALLDPLITCDNEQQQHHPSHQHQQHHAHCGCSSSSSSTSSENSSCSIISNSSQRTDPRTAHSDEKSITKHSAGSYQSLADILMEEGDMQDQQHSSYGTLLPTHYQNRSLTVTDYNDTHPPSNAISPLMQVSVCLVDAAWVALDLAQAYVEEAHGNKGIVGFITCMFRIWKVLFLGAETMLGWGNHRLSPQAVV
ncbi:hypothetical protein HMPREF1544_11481 [Mucor circinelloides 1006PhL]|uniref:Uncharacterized protein n=1 Tax=Mucor circinelloides f. circinelloides (strain 1006PhL) TaxID=1220926 RepID=S2IVR9_MUCC1|nr:hypothetical protein HMPREF1544_11481 [Mucor circinelloides 1006PhL]